MNLSEKMEIYLARREIRKVKRQIKKMERKNAVLDLTVALAEKELERLKKKQLNGGV